MISKISFGSTYRACTCLISPEKLNEFREFAISLRENNRDTVEFGDCGKLHRIPKCNDSCILVVPDEMDEKVDDFCNKNNIKPDKCDTELYTIPDVILARIKNPPKGMRKVKVNSEELQKLTEKQRNNFKALKMLYDTRYKSKMKFLIESGMPISASTLKLELIDKDIQDNFEQSGGISIDNLPSRALYAKLNSLTKDDIEQYMYFAMQDFGIKEVPMYVNDETYKIANALGILMQEK